MAGIPAPDYQSVARQAAEKYGINPDIFVRQINQESGFNPTPGPGGALCNSAGACGIAQIVPGAHPGVDVSNPVDSLYYAARLMSSFLGQFGGDWRKALIAYNAGTGPVSSSDQRPRPNLIDFPVWTWPAWFHQPIEYVMAILGVDIRTEAPPYTGGVVSLPPDNPTTPPPSTIPGGKDVGPDNPMVPGPGTTTPGGKDVGPAPGASVTPVFSGQIIKIDTTPTQVGPWSVDLPSGISLVPEAVTAFTGAIRRRVIPFLIGLVITILGGELMSRGDAKTKVLGSEVVVVGISIMWFAYRDTTLMAWDAIKP